MNGHPSPLLEASLRLSAMLVAPGAATEGMGTRQVLSVGVVALLGYLLMLLVALPFVLRLLSPVDAPIRPSLASIAVLLALQGSITSALLCVRWFFVAYVVWAFASAWGRSMSFVAGAGVVVLAEAPRLLENALTLMLIIPRRGPVESLRDLRPPIGVNLYIDGLSPRWDALLNQVNPFQVWHVVVLALGIRSVFRTSAAVAFFLAFGLWLVGLVVQFVLSGS